MQLLKPTNDVSFKKIFSQDDILVNFINVITRKTDHEKVVQITRLNTELLRSRANDKLCVPDLLCTAEDGSTFLVEMQLWPQEGFSERVQYYGTRLVADQMEKGDHYNSALKPIIVISVCAFTLFPQLNAYSNHRFIDEETNLHTLKLLRFIFLQIDKLPDLTDDAIAGLDLVNLWMYFFKNPDTLFSAKSAVEQKNKNVVKAIEALNKTNWDPKELKLYRAYNDQVLQEHGRLEYYKNEGRAEGRAEGKAEGEAEEGIRIARQMLLNQMPVETIASCIGLSLETIRDLRSQQD